MADLFQTVCLCSEALGRRTQGRHGEKSGHVWSFIPATGRRLSGESTDAQTLRNAAELTGWVLSPSLWLAQDRTQPCGWMWDLCFVAREREEEEEDQKEEKEEENEGRRRRGRI